MAANEADGEKPLDPNIHRVDARTLRGLAHPLRLRLLNTLREFGPATASGLADRLGESSGATSYHLRQLATYGFVEDAPDARQGPRAVVAGRAHGYGVRPDGGFPA